MAEVHFRSDIEISIPESVFEIARKILEEEKEKKCDICNELTNNCECTELDRECYDARLDIE